MGGAKSEVDLQLFAEGAYRKICNRRDNCEDALLFFVMVEVTGVEPVSGEVSARPLRV